MKTKLRSQIVAGHFGLLAGLAFATVHLQAASLSDWLKVGVDGKKVTVTVNPKLPVEIQPSGPNAASKSATNVFDYAPPNGPIGETSSATPLPPLPDNSVSAATTDSVPPPVGAALPPTTVNSSKATTVTPTAGALNDGGRDSNPGSLERGVDTANTPAVVAPPIIKIVPLTKIQSWYDRIKGDGPESGRTFRVSRDGEHCVSIQRLGLTARTVQIDGQPGPEFTAIIGEIFPSKDFSRAFYLAHDANSQRVLVIQDRNGSAKVYPVSDESEKNPGKWVVDVRRSLENCRLIRVRNPESMTVVQGVNNYGYHVQVDENGPVSGPLRTSGTLLFDELGSHYLLSSRVWTNVPGVGETQPEKTALFSDGVRVGQDLLPDFAVTSKPVDIQQQKVLPNGAYWVGFGNRQFGNTNALLNGTQLINFPGRPVMEPVFSPNGKQLATVVSTDQGRIICRNGKAIASYPVGASVENLKFTDDSQSLIYTVRVSPMTSVFVDGQAVFTASAEAVYRLWAGPRQGQFACLVGKDLVINGRRLPLVTTNVGLFTPKQLWFTANGEHVYGHGEAPGKPVIAFFDNVTAKAEMNGQPFSPGELLEAVSSDDSRWQMVGSNRPGTTARTFFRVEVGNRPIIAQAN